tara:strand:- start:544 stop:774 length:231 start_codon:yes stop_codon:yes gene_type:complete
MVLPEDSNNALCDLLDRIADSLERNTDILNRIADHYDGIVPTMTKNAKRVEKAHEDMENDSATFSLAKIFGTPQEH